jgi:hypothetical protein
MEELEEQRVCVKFCCEFGKNFKEAFQLLNQAYARALSVLVGALFKKFGLFLKTVA